MAEGGVGRGRGGRGAMIAKLLEMQNKPGQPPAPPAGDGPFNEPASIAEQARVSQPPPNIGGRGAMFLRMQQAQAMSEAAERVITPQQPPVIGGRGAMLQKLQQATAEHPQSSISIGRGKVLQTLESQALGRTSQSPEDQSPPVPKPDVEDVRRQMRRMEIVPDRPPLVMQGTSGQRISVTANYIPLYLQPGRGIYEYEVRYHPPVDDRLLCEKLLFAQHRDLFGRHRRTFDGVTLYLPHKLPDEALKLKSTHPVTNETHDIVLNFRREKAMTECTHMYNVLFKNIQKELNLIQLDRKYYSQDLAHSIPQHKLEIWPGFTTAVDAFEGGIMLNCDASHKVLRTQTVYDLINEIIASCGARDWKDILQKQLIGQTVMTKRPVRTYRVDDIDFSQNPTSMFQNRDGESMSYIEYHRRKDIPVKDHKQPLLVHRPTKPNRRPGGTGLILLIPELCYLTGLTDEMRSDFKVMKDVAMYTRINPNQRQLALQKFINNIKASPNCVKLLDEWGLKVPETTVELTGRTMQPEEIHFGRNYVERGSSQADWGRSSTSQHMLEVINIKHWIVIFSQRDERNATGFIDMMAKVGGQMGVEIKEPIREKIRDDRTETYLKSLRDGISECTQVVVIIFPSARDDRYAAVKKLCCVDRPIPSQVINSRTISRPDKLRSIVQKIALQINCKLGGALWAVKIPFKRAMICGIDTYHDSKIRAKSVAAFVASMNPSVTRWHSQVLIQTSERELVDGLRTALLVALNKYFEVNGYHPDTVIIYRDGVGDGQLKVCEEHEVEALKKAFISISPDYQPYLAFIICQKRINTRIFLSKSGGQYDNPPPGTVVDYCVTRRYLHDFYLISQLVRQGTVTPTHYIVLYNSTKLDPDKLQKITYKMCHLYYNWPGTVRVPAPCQYAHKLAHLVGCSIHRDPALVLCDKLFFL